MRDHGHFTDIRHQYAAMTFLAISASYVFSKRRMAPRARFELATLRLTAECSTVELPGNRATRFFHSNTDTRIEPPVSQDNTLWAISRFPRLPSSTPTNRLDRTSTQLLQQPGTTTL